MNAIASGLEDADKLGTERSATIARGASVWLWVLTAGSLALSLWCLREVRVMQGELAQRPPVAVVAVSEELQNGASNGSGSVEQAAMRIKSAGKRLRDQGYVVLNGDDLVAYPKVFAVHPAAGADEDAP